MATPKDDIVSIFKTEGLDAEFWLPLFDKMHITSKATLEHIDGDMMIYKKLQKHAKFDWEKKALCKVLNIKDEDPKMKLKSTLGGSSNIEKQCEMKDRSSHELSHDEAVALNSEMVKIEVHKDNDKANPSIESVKTPVENSKRRYKQLQEVSHSNNFSKLLGTASSSRALHGVLLSKNVKHHLLSQSSLLQTPNEVLLKPTYQTVEIVKQFSLKSQEEKYKKLVENFGHRVASPETYPVCGKTLGGSDVATYYEPSQAQHRDRDLSMEMYSSVVKHSTVQLATYYFSNSDLKLSDDALHELKKLNSLITSNGEGIQTECENFLKKFGSHISRGPIHFGGVCWWTCSSKGFHCREREGLKKLQYQVISAVGGVGFSEKNEIRSIKRDFDRKCSGNTLANTHLEVKLNGGHGEANDFKSWKGDLARSDCTWIVTDPGNTYIAVWDIIAMNYAKELCETMDVLCTVWERMTGILREQVQLSSFRSDTVLECISEWNKLKSHATRHNLEYLIEIKSDLIIMTGNSDAWMERYLCQPPLQEFLLSVISLEQDKRTPAGDIRFLMQQLVDPFDLQRMTSANFHDKDRLSRWLYNEDPENLLSYSKDIKMLVKYLQSIIEEMEFAKDSSDLLIGRSTEPSKIRDAETKAAKAILSFQSYYKDSLEDILIVTLIHPFISSDSKDQIELQPVAKDDLKFLHEQFKEQWKKFAYYKDQKNPLRFQAYLFYLAVNIYSVKEVEHKEIQLKRCLVYIKDSLSSFCQLDPPIANLLSDYLTCSCQLVPFQERMETIMRTGRPLIPLNAAKDLSLQQALFTDIHHKLMLPEKLEISFIKNQKVHHLFQELDLCDYYPKKLGMEDALRIRPDILRISLHKSPVSHSSQLVQLVLHKVMAYDYLCRSDLMHDHKHRSTKIHPVDILLAILICSDDFLNQDLMSRLAKCQIAIPFILPDPFTEQLVLPLWAMRSVVTEWKYVDKKGNVLERGCPIVNYKTPIVSFIRIGKHQKRGASKSKIMNEVISESHYDHFFDRDCAGGHFKQLMGEGLIDMCWYLPAAKPDDVLPVAVTFLNLHGDARQYTQQCKLLSAISSMCFVLLTEEESVFDQHCTVFKSLKPFVSTLGGIVLLNDADEPPEKLQKALSNSESIDLSSMNAHDTKKLIRKMIIERLPLNCVDQFKSLEQCADVALGLHLDKLSVDEGNDNFRKGKQLADKLIKLASSGESGYLGAKQAFLPLQGQDMWQAWAKKDKELHRQVQRGECSVHEYVDMIETKKRVIREQQLQYVSRLTPVMESFVVTILSLGGISNTTTRNFYLQCLKIGLNDLSRTSISELQVKYVAIRQALHEAQVKINSTESDNQGELSKVLDHHKKEINKLHTDLVNASFGLEHLLRELGQLYETAEAQHSFDPTIIEQLSRLPEAAAELLIDGYPLEIMDGDAAHVPIKWIKAVLCEVGRILDDPKVYVMSVLGLQSTRKSTMLNTSFGLHFNVSAGRCTRGAFMQLLPVSEEMRQETGCAYILVVDTEGLRTPELDSQQTQKHDNELATFVIGLANVTLINVYGEVLGDMHDILQTSVRAFLRMNKVKYNPSCQFVHQNAEANVNSEMGSANLTQKLNNMTLEAAKAESCAGQYKAFSDVIQFDDQRDVHHFPGLWKGDPPMAPVNRRYSECAQNLKSHIVSLLEQGARIDVLSLFETKLDNLWDALLTENFVFSFLEITAYNSLEVHYNTCDWNFQKCMLEWEIRAENDINAADPEDISDVMLRKKKDAEVYVQKKYEELVQEMDNFFEASNQSDTLSQWKAKFELKLERLSEELKLHAQGHCENVFSYKNSHDSEKIIAYNSLEAQYNSCDWKFRECMLEWEERAKNDINAADPEDISDVMLCKKKDAEVYVQKKYEELVHEMDNFFEANNQSDTLSQWKAKFELKLEHLSEELKLHAQDHCENVFSFKNSPDSEKIIAYNSLEVHYNTCNWNFQKCMLEWEMRAENDINAADPEDISDVMLRKKKDAKVYVQKKYEELVQEMDNFFEASNQSDTLSQWKAKFELKLEHLSEELKLHAQDHCENVFSFKNSHDSEKIFAYNSLEAQYNSCDWKFRECMLEWEERAKNDINAADPEDISDVMLCKKKDAEVYVQKKYEELMQEMDNFFEASSQSDTLSQWKAKFELKLEGLSEELKLHAQHHCETVGADRPAKLGFEKKYAVLITKKVENIIQQIKQEQELLNTNLERGKLNQAQVQMILKQGLFELAKLENYRKLKIITKSQLDRLKTIYQSQCVPSKKLLTEDQLRQILEGQPRILSLHEIRTILKQGELTPVQLRHEFDKMWIDLMNTLPVIEVNVEEAVEEMLIKFMGEEESKLINQLKRRTLRNFGSREPFKVIEGTHYIKIRGSHIEQIVTVLKRLERINEPHKRKAQTITDEVFELAMKYLDDKESEKTDFHKSYTSELLHKLEEFIKKQSDIFSNQFTFTTLYRIDVFLSVCGHAIGRFEEMARAFRDPRIYLEKLKQPLFTKFKNQYYRTAKEEAIACILCAHLAEPVETQVRNSLGIHIVERMKMSVNGSCFTNKIALKARILIDLGDGIMASGGRQREHLSDYFTYITDQKRSLRDWLHKYTFEYCDTIVGKNSSTQLQEVAKEDVSRLVLFIKKKVDKIKMVDANEWLKEFCEDKDLISELGVKLIASSFQCEGMQELNISTFKEQLLHELSELKLKILSQFRGITYASSIHTWMYKPVDILMKQLCGCTEQCPFCKEQCDYVLHDLSIKHVVFQHRPRCLGGYKNTPSNVMTLTVCSADVAGTQTFKTNDTNQEIIPFSEYDKIYPTWSIPPDATATNSIYWKWFIGIFHEEIATFFQAKDAEIPDSWKQLKWENVKKDLMMYKL